MEAGGEGGVLVSTRNSLSYRFSVCRSTVNRIFKTLSYDETPEDPWQYFPCISQDVLTSEMKPLRVKAARHIMANSTSRSWYGQVYISPCYTSLPKTEERLDEQRIAAMGKLRCQSEESNRNGPNLRVPQTCRDAGARLSFLKGRLDTSPRPG